MKVKIIGVKGIDDGMGELGASFNNNLSKGNKTTSNKEICLCYHWNKLGHMVQTCRTLHKKQPNNNK